MLPSLVTVVAAETSELMSVDVGVGVSCAQAGNAGARAGMRAKAPGPLQRCDRPWPCLQMPTPKKERQYEKSEKTAGRR